MIKLSAEHKEYYLTTIQLCKVVEVIEVYRESHDQDDELNKTKEIFKSLLNDSYLNFYTFSALISTITFTICCFWVSASMMTEILKHVLR